MLVTAGEIQHKLFVGGCLNPESLHHFLRLLAFYTEVQKAHASMCLQRGHADVLADRHLQEHALLLSVFRNKCNSGSDGISRRPHFDESITNSDLTGKRCIDPENRTQSFCSPGTDQSGDADDLARAQREIQAVPRPCLSHQILNLKDSITCGVRLP